MINSNLAGFLRPPGLILKIRGVVV